jgi:hypothetical protein
MKIPKRQLRRIIKEETAKLNEANPLDLGARMGGDTLEGWANQDDAVEMIDPEGVYEMYTDESGGEQELNYIIKRLREAYALGGGVAKITIYDMKSKG